MFEKDNSLHMIYSEHNGRAETRASESGGSISTVKISPLPDSSSFYIFPRFDARNPNPDIDNRGLSFNRFQELNSSWVNTLGNGDFSIVARIYPRNNGVLLDSRAGSSGFGINLRWSDGSRENIKPMVFFPGKGAIVSDSEIPLGEWTDLSIRIVNGQEVVFNINGVEERKPFSSLNFLPGEKADLSSTNPLRVGRPSGESSWKPLWANMAFIAIYDRAITNNKMDSIFQGGDLSDGKSYFKVNGELVGFEYINWHAISEDNAIISIRGEGSGAIDQPLSNPNTSNWKVSIPFEFALCQGCGDQTLLTMGPPKGAVRIVRRDSRVLIKTPTQTIDWTDAPNGWFDIVLLLDGDQLSITTQNADKVSLSYLGTSSQLYLGEGYPSVLAGNEQMIFRVDMARIVTTIETEKEL